MGPIPHAWLFWHGGQRICVCLSDHGGVLQLLANSASSDCGEHELCHLDHRLRCNVQLELLYGLGPEGLQWARGGNIMRLIVKKDVALINNADLS